MKELVRLRTRPSRDGKTFKYMLDYMDESGKRRQISLGHTNKRKIERQKARKERELRMGVVAVKSMKLSDFLADSLTWEWHIKDTDRRRLPLTDEAVSTILTASSGKF